VARAVDPVDDARMARRRGALARAQQGSATTLAALVDFYDARFAVGFTAAEKADLVAFLNAL
jgi:hypothetical protein